MVESLNLNSATRTDRIRGQSLPAMQTNRQLVNALRAAPMSWIDVAIVIAFENRIELVAEDHPDPLSMLNALEEQGGLAIGLAGVRPGAYGDRAFLVQVFQEYEGQAWAYRYMDRLRGIFRSHSLREMNSHGHRPL